MLMALDLPMPKQVFAHGYITIKGDRMSKSSGNVVAPDEVMQLSGADPFRYYLLAENQFSQDGNFTWDALLLKNNADLANDWGNLVNRSINMARKYFPEETLQLPQTLTHSAEVKASFEALVGELQAAVQQIDPARYASACSARSRLLNLYIDRTKPWSLAKLNTPESKQELREVLFTLLEGIRWLATGWRSILPFGMPEVFKQLNLSFPSEQGALMELKWGAHGICPAEPHPIYPRIEAKPAETT
jgi:methionyl-tRNA synthetase